MVEQFAPESADKALGEGVHVRGPDRGANTTLVPMASNRHANRAPSLASRSTTALRAGRPTLVSRLLRTPVIGRRPGDCSVHDSPSLQIEKEQEKIGRKSTSNVSTCCRVENRRWFANPSGDMSRGAAARARGTRCTRRAEARPDRPFPDRGAARGSSREHAQAETEHLPLGGGRGVRRPRARRPIAPSPEAPRRLA